MLLYHYAVIGLDNKAVYIIKDNDGWLHFSGKLANNYQAGENIFGSIEEIEIVLNHKLKLSWEAKLDKDGLVIKETILRSTNGQVTTLSR